MIIIDSSGPVLEGSVPVEVSIGEVFWKVIVVGFGYSLDDAMPGEFRILDEVGRELTFGLHGEIKWKGGEAFQVSGSFKEHY